MNKCIEKASEKLEVQAKKYEGLNKGFNKLLKEVFERLTEEGKEALRDSNEYNIESKCKTFKSYKTINKLEKIMNSETVYFNKDKSLITLLKQEALMFDLMIAELKSYSLQGIKIEDFIPPYVVKILSKLEQLDAFLEYVYAKEFWKSEDEIKSERNNNHLNDLVSISCESSLNEPETLRKVKELLENNNEASSELVVAAKLDNFYNIALVEQTFDNEFIKQYSKESQKEVEEYISFLNNKINKKHAK